MVADGWKEEEEEEEEEEKKSVTRMDKHVAACPPPFPFSLSVFPIPPGHVLAALLKIERSDEENKKRRRLRPPSTATATTFFSSPPLPPFLSLVITWK